MIDMHMQVEEMAKPYILEIQRHRGIFQNQITFIGDVMEFAQIIAAQQDPLGSEPDPKSVMDLAESCMTQALEQTKKQYRYGPRTLFNIISPAPPDEVPYSP